ncbi:hypothetical protein [Bradyrhizobium cosmicum]|uniref:hypothetical protein n=1 Tax=Bradyrhizobium cosmicum TaxID=1404864 RepID=UPI0011651689|nr:hypothetical protein [Bradyrhizobium cosmicum]QDP22643.1 hypothetical protein FNV92_10920 [Bradyrhizobium cosmicum]
MVWTPMFALPNVQIAMPIEVQHFGLIAATDPRIVELKKKYKNFASYLGQFSTEFGNQVTPSLLMWDDKGPQTYRNTEAISAFRDTIALSITPYAWARNIRFQRPENVRFSDWFNIYPWMIDKNYEHVVMQNSGGLNLHDTKLLKAQTTPGISPEVIRSNEIDDPLLRALLARWEIRFTAEKPEWNDLKLFRAINMANVAGALPSQGDFTPYDEGRALALWASAFEILAHPGDGQSGHLQVYDLLDRADWKSPACQDARHPAMAPTGVRRPRILACAIYSRIHTARNNYLHGNPVSAVQLIIEPYKRYLLDYAPILFRMALAASLDLRFKEAAPNGANEKAIKDYKDREFAFGYSQRTMEAALGTFYMTRHEQNRRSGRVIL